MEYDNKEKTYTKFIELTECEIVYPTFKYMENEFEIQCNKFTMPCVANSSSEMVSFIL
jgi:hypothetical protein